MTFLSFIIGDLKLACQIDNIEGVIEDIKTVPIPKSPDYIIGIANVRNRIIPVLSLATLLNKKLKKGKQWIISAWGENRYLCEIDEVADLIEVDELTPAKAKKPGIIVGTIEYRGEIYSVIDLRRISRR